MRPKSDTKTRHSAKVLTSINSPTWKCIKKRPHRNHQRNITWLNQPYGKNLETKVGSQQILFIPR